MLEDDDEGSDKCDYDVASEGGAEHEAEGGRSFEVPEGDEGDEDEVGIC